MDPTHLPFFTDVLHGTQAVFPCMHITVLRYRRIPLNWNACKSSKLSAGALHGAHRLPWLPCLCYMNLNI